MSADIDRRFDYHPPTGARIDQHRTIRDDVKCLAETFDEALMWANAAIARAETST